MDDNTLREFCLTTTHNFQLCDEIFWYQRIAAHGLTPLLPFRSFYKSLPEFYFNIRQDACYIVANVDSLVLSNLRAYDNITAAYNAAKEDKRPTLITVFICNNTMSSEDIINRYAFWSTTELNSNILNYPKLAERKFVITQERTINFLSEGVNITYYKLLNWCNETLLQQSGEIWFFKVNSNKESMLFRKYGQHYVCAPTYPTPETILFYYQRTLGGSKYFVATMRNFTRVNQGGHRTYVAAINYDMLKYSFEDGYLGNMMVATKGTIVSIEDYDGK